VRNPILRRQTIIVASLTKRLEGLLRDSDLDYDLDNSIISLILPVQKVWKEASIRGTLPAARLTLTVCRVT